MFIVILSMLVATIGNAQEAAPTYTVRQILLERDRAVIQFTGELKDGAELVATFANGKQCPLKVTAIKDKLGNVDTSKCADAKELTVGQKLEPSLAIEETPASVEVSQPAPPPSVETPVIPPTPDPSPEPTPEAAVAIIQKPEYVRALTDLQLMPEAGHTLVEVDYLMAKGTDKLKNPATSQEISNSEGSGNSLIYSFGYGVSDQFTLGVEASQILKSESKISYGPGSTIDGVTEKYKSNGWDDPTYYLKYRIIEQSWTHLNVDASVGYSPKSGNSTDATTTRSGNAKRGGDLVVIFGELGQKFPKASYSVRAGAAFHGSSASSDAGASLKTTSDAYTNGFAMGRGQVKASDQVFVRGLVRLDSYSDRKWSTPGSSDVVGKSYVQATLGLDLLFSPAPNVVLQIGLRKTMPEDVKGQVGTTDIEETPEGTSTSLGALFTF